MEASPCSKLVCNASQYAPTEPATLGNPATIVRRIAEPVLLIAAMPIAMPMKPVQIVLPIAAFATAAATEFAAVRT